MDATSPASTTYADAPLLRRFMRRTGAFAPMSWLYARVLHRLDRPVFRLTRGRTTFTSWVTGLPVVMLTSTGARTGAQRTVPVLGLPLSGPLPPRGGPGPVAVIASNYGQQHHPGWMYNLDAHPDAKVGVGGESWPVRARRVEGDERARIWESGLRVYPGWTAYTRRCPLRTFVVFVLEPAG